VADTAETIVFDLRLPRVLSAMIVGFGLAVAGATFQGLLRNPLADPYVLGTASGAALGAAIAVLIPVRIAVLEFGLVHGLAFVGALISIWVVYRLSRTGTLAPLTSLLLTGYAVGSLLAAGLAMTMYLSGSNLPDLLLPSRRLRRIVLAATGGRAPAHCRREPRDHGRSRRSMDSSWAEETRPTSGSTSGGSGSSSSRRSRPRRPSPCPV
jgi:ABC-type Fe3+-siderophore transport system permease subunit